MRAQSFLTIAAAVIPVAAHGGVFNYTIDGIEYPGHYPWWPLEGQVSIQRRWYPDPIVNLSHPYMACNRGNPLQLEFPKQHGLVKAGGIVEAYYTPPKCPDNWVLPSKPMFPEYGDASPAWCIDSAWYHYWGPMNVYLADCQGPCDQYDAAGERWFKIWETGYSPTGWPAGSIEESPITERRTWEQNELHSKSIRVTIPKELKSGHYLIRHEVYFTEGEKVVPQLFPTCAQIEVVGNGTQLPTAEYLVSFPGAYKYSDPAFANQGEWNLKERSQTYNFSMPGPKIWSPSPVPPKD